MTTDPDTARRRVLDAYCRAAGVDPGIVDEPGITVAGEMDRAGTGIASAYQLGRHLLVRCDPEVVGTCREMMTGTSASTLEGFESVAPESAERQGRGFVHVFGAPVATPNDLVRTFDRALAADVDLIRELIAADPGGADDAEIEIEQLDEHAVGIEVDGSLATLVSERPWPTDPRFGDIGVLTHPTYRRQGLARATLLELCRRMLAGDRMPLYRCDAANRPSKALADGAGFVEVVRLSAIVL